MCDRAASRGQDGYVAVTNETCAYTYNKFLCIALPTYCARLVAVQGVGLEPMSLNGLVMCLIPLFRLAALSPVGYDVMNMNDQMNDFDDLSGAQELALGEIVAKKFGSDFFFLDRFPTQIRPFYTMPCPDDKRYVVVVHAVYCTIFSVVS